jgi:hypothetical protein
MTRMIILVAALVGSGLALVEAGQAGLERFSRYWGPRYRPLPPAPSPSAPPDSLSLLRAVPEPAPVDALHHWNHVAIDMSGLDHTPPAEGETRVFGEQFGPGRAARAMAIVHIAIFDAVNSIAHKYHGFTGIPDVSPGASVDAAIAAAAHLTLSDLFPSQRAQSEAMFAQDMARIPESPAKQEGLETGRRAAERVLELTRHDGSHHEELIVGETYFPSTMPAKWTPDPVSGSRVVIGARWGMVRPMVLRSVRAHRAPAPPALTSAEYTEAFNEVIRLGGDGITTPTERTDEQTMIGIYWAYDGTPSLCAPPRMYNQITMTIADQMGTTGVDLARLLALVNVAMSDAAIVTWESKFHWNFWRPVTGIREAERGIGWRTSGDGNPDTSGDATFTPLGAPATELQGPDFTPPFPSYPSGHAAFGGAVFQVLRHFYGTDDIPFTFVSDELNGRTRDRHGAVRPLLPRSFARLSQAEEENGQSRIYLGIHWSFDKTAGIKQGRGIADEVFRKAARPRTSASKTDTASR